MIEFLLLVLIVFVIIVGQCISHNQGVMVERLEAILKKLDDDNVDNWDDWDDIK